MTDEKRIALIRDLCAIDGVSGREDKVREFIIGSLPADVTYKTDPMGNLIVSKKGKRTPDKKLMICAHMDEVGFIITYVTDEGYLKFDTLGGISEAVMIGRTVKLESGVTGVIGLKHTHQCTKEEKLTIPPAKNLHIDIGAKSKADAEKYAMPGSYAVFNSEFEQFGTNDEFLKSKALDDRLGCALMVELINSDIELDTEFVFTVQEEIGARGALTAAYAVQPDIAVVLETTTAGDICGVSGDKKACELGKGPVISYMDRGTVYDFDLYKRIMEYGRAKEIPIQTKSLVAGGNDSSSVQRTGSGAKTAAVSVPCRYLHSAVCVINKNDISATLRLLKELANLL